MIRQAHYERDGQRYAMFCVKALSCSLQRAGDMIREYALKS